MEPNIPFIGRRDELTRLKSLLTRKTSSLVVIRGRRRIGKSRLVEEFARGKVYYSFTGLPPTPFTTAQSQRNEFARQMGEQLGLPGLQADDWANLLTLLAKHTAQRQCIIFLDEISWMGSKDPDFLGKLKIVWDLYFSKNPKLIFILCGSISSWIEKNIISSTAFFGRIALKITLDELSLLECNILLDKLNFKGSVLEKLMWLAITGGVPWYIELINNQLSVSDNIHRLCFEPDGILVDKFKNIFHDLFGKRGKTYKEIVSYLTKGPAEYSDISAALDYASGGPLSEYLADLILSGFVSRDFIWDIKSNKESKLSRYRLRDNYLRFYLKYIATHLNKIKKNQLQQLSITSLPGWESMMGFQFENMVLNNRNAILHQLGIKPEEVVFDNPFFQRKTKENKGCQIDYLIQTKFNILYVCEIKFSKREISANVITEVQEKIDSLRRPKGFSCIPVLIHANGISNEIVENNYFGKLIDFSQLLNPDL